MKKDKFSSIGRQVWASILTAVFVCCISAIAHTDSSKAGAENTIEEAKTDKSVFQPGINRSGRHT